MRTARAIGGFGALEAKSAMLEHITRLTLSAAGRGAGAVGPTYIVEPAYFDMMVGRWTDYAAALGRQHGYQVTSSEVKAALTGAGWRRAAPGETPEIGVKRPEVVYEAEPTRQVLAEDAITYVLTGGRWTPFPAGVVEISAFDFDKLVAAAWEVARRKSAAYSYIIPHTELAQVMADRGYRVKTAAPQAPTAPTIPTPTATLVSRTRAPFPGKVTLPTIIPRKPPGAETPPPVLQEKAGTSWMLWAGLAAIAVYFLAKERTPHSSTRNKTAAGPISGLSGETANCVLWQEVEGRKTGGLIWRCLAYANPCDGKSCTSPTRLPPRQKYQLRVCVDTKKVKTTSPRFKAETVDRCAKYSRVCPDGACIPEAMPKPEPSPGHGSNVRSMVRSLAKNMAQERNEIEEAAGKKLARDILERGGIRSHRKGREKEEYREIPLTLKRKTGLPADEMASEMGMDEEALMELIRREYPKGKKKKRRFHWKDFEAQAESQVWSAVDAGVLSGLGAMTWEERHDPQRGSWRHFWQKPGEKPKQVTPGRAFTLTHKYPGEGTMYLLRAWSAEEGRRQIAEGLIEPYHTPKRQHKPPGYEEMAQRSQVVAPKEHKGPVFSYRPPEQLPLFGLGAEALLFPGLRREMVLEAEDVSTSDDPLEIHLERKGWQMSRVRELQASMAEKAVPDLFTGKTKPLSAGEKKLQRDINEFFAKKQAYREAVQAKHASA